MDPSLKKCSKPEGECYQEGYAKPQGMLKRTSCYD